MGYPKNETSYIQKLIAEGEHQKQDFKFAISDIRKIAKSISAFSNTEGGRLLIGVKDNGKIAGIHSEEEFYMIEAAACRYCSPPVSLQTAIHHLEGKDIMEVIIAESTSKPVYALDEQNKKWACIRINDENILANMTHLNIWKHNNKDQNTIIVYTQQEQQLLNILKQHSKLTLNQCCRFTHNNRNTTSKILADFIRFDLIEQVFQEHTFYFRLKEDK